MICAFGRLFSIQSFVPVAKKKHTNKNQFHTTFLRKIKTLRFCAILSFKKQKKVQKIEQL